MTITAVLVLWLAYGLVPVSWGWVVALVLLEFIGAVLKHLREKRR